MMQNEDDLNISRKVSVVPNGKIIHLDSKNDEDLQFIRETYGYETEEKGWFREMDRLFLISGALTGKTAQSKLRRLLGQNHTDELLEKLRCAFRSDHRKPEQDLVNEYTKKGFFYGSGRFH